MRAWYGEKLREYFSKHNPLKLLDLGGNVFSSATVDSNILVIQNVGNKWKTLSCIISDHSRSLDLQMKKATLTHFMTTASWFIWSSAEIDLKTKIEKIWTPLREWNIKMNFWVKTWFNEAFIIDWFTRNKLIEESISSDKIIKPVSWGKSIQKYNYSFSDTYLITTFPALQINIEDYSAIKAHLLNFGQDRLEQSWKDLWNERKARKKTGNKWFETQDQIWFYNEFLKEKIVWREITSEQSFCIVPAGVYVYAPATFLVANEHLKYILWFLNSKLTMWMFSSIAHTLWDTWLEWKKAKIETLSLIPVSPTNEATILKIESLVETIMNEKKVNITNDTSVLEWEINALFYKLYDLTPEEIAIIEGK